MENDQIYCVVKNGDDQYNIWPIDREIPDGWESIDRTGTKSECLELIAELS